MNHFAGYTRSVTGGHLAMLRLAHDAKPMPVLGKNGEPTIFPTEPDAWRAVVKHLLAYFNGDLRRDGEIASARSEADALFPSLVKQRGKTGVVKVEHVKSAGRRPLVVLPGRVQG